MIGPLSYLDAALLAIALLSGLLAMYRGLTREVLSIISWVVAAAAVLYFVLFQTEIAADIAKQIGTKTPIAQVGIGGIIFLIVLVVVHLITSRISDALLDSRVGVFDRIFGFVFGVARGFLLVVIVYMLALLYKPEFPQQVDWVRNAASREAIESTGVSLKSWLETMLARLDGDGATRPPGRDTTSG